MEYERIHQKAQAGALSPTKLRMKLLGAHNRVRVITSSNSSSRTSPVKNIETSQVQNRLLVSDVLEEASDTSDGSKRPSAIDKTEAVEKDSALSSLKVQNTSKSSVPQPASSNSSIIYPVRTVEEDGNDCDSGLDNASTSSFEFHGGEKSVTQNPASGYFARQTSSKWNDAEKWIVNRQNVNQNIPKGTVPNQTTHQMNSVAARGAIVPRFSGRVVQNMKRVNPAHSASRSILERLSFASHQPKLIRHADVFPVNNGSTTSEHHKAIHPGSSTADFSVKPCNDHKVPSVSLRDVGTEMTPIPSQEPSRTATPLGSMTPTRSPNCSIPSTPVGGRSTTSPPWFKKE